MRSVVIGSLVLLCGVAVAQPPRQPPAAQPLVKRTVDAFAGTWTGDATLGIPGKPLQKVKVTSTCHKIAGGAGVSCELKQHGKTSMPVDQTCLIGYDTEGSGVHLMCVTAAGEAHDHQGTWQRSDKIEFQPYKGTMMGKEATEDLTFEWTSPKVFAAHGKTTLADGQTSTFDLILKKH
ncbi:MAG TPA: hypothetical protein VGQ83_23420 [Polyangia bacterium]|jgi:hypothetical protein